MDLEYKPLESIIKKYSINNIEKLNKGWSSDLKFILTSVTQDKYLLRISFLDKYETKLQQFNLLKKLDDLQINCSKALEIGILDNQYCYLILSYLEGVEGKIAIHNMNDQDAYKIGVEAGIILKKLHSVDIEIPSFSWWDKYQEKIKRKISNLLNCNYRIPFQEEILTYYQDHLNLMKNRPLSFSHGDYHLGNLIIDNNKIGVIDFDKNTIADPYDDFKPFCWNVLESEYFETGLINGYFNDEIPEDFFKILKFYTAESLISHLPWAIKFGQEEIDIAYDIAEKQMEWWNNFNLDIPTWYKGVLK